jgi:hypothetical protein
VKIGADAVGEPKFERLPVRLFSNRAKGSAANGVKPITLDFCCELNARVLKNLELEDDVKAGEIRHHSVVVGNVYRGAPPEDCAYLVETMCDNLQREAGPTGLEHQPR